MNNDLISRSELKKAIESIKQNVEEWVNHTDCDITIALAKIKIYELFIDLIDNAPTITPKLPTEVRKALEVLDTIEQNRWVPVSEKLPEENVCDDGYHEPSECVLVQASNGSMYTTRYWTRDKNNVWTDLRYPEDIVAWQPLPGRYKEGGEE